MQERKKGLKMLEVALMEVHLQCIFLILIILTIYYVEEHEEQKGCSIVNMLMVGY